ncbi:MAG TPA: hypothetical protein VED63_01100 [Acidimicrobiales bacterium]|nr:hypothetical protein [Acidimicrobiales bacterium]
MHVRRPELVLGAAVAICLPMVPGILSGNVNTTTAGTRFLGALVICWIGGSVIGWIIDRYTAEARRSQVVKMLAATRRERRPDAGGALPPDQS